MKSPLVENVLVADIKIGTRRREDFGDIEGLAESIRKYQLLHPIVVDDELNLIAGERRLRAHTLLGRTEILVRYLRDLTEDERREIELEENLHRKDLTPYERSRELVKLVETAAAIDRQEAETLSNANRVSKRGPQPVPGSDKRVAERTGIPQPTISVARQHVAAVTKYPELAVVAPTQKDAITVAKNLDALGDGERSEARSRLLKHDQNTLASLAEKPPMPRARVSLDKSPSVKWSEWLTGVRTGLGGLRDIGSVTRHWSPDEALSFAADLRGFRDELDTLITGLEEQQHGLEQQVG